MSIYEPCANTKGFTALASLIVLRVLFIDILTSLVDVVSDFAQAAYLLTILDEQNRFYGYVVLAANWAPGIVAVIHLLAFYREGYISEDKSLKKKAIKKLIKMVLFCFFFFPILPTIGYLFMLLNMNMKEKSEKLLLLDTIAQTAHSIAGCIEAPIQLALTIYLIFIGLLEIPDFLTTQYGRDEFGNLFYKFNMPMFSMIFSFINILTCAMKINIFNVYIVQIRKLDDMKRFLTLSAGYFPFFLHSIMFRIFSYVVIVIFLNRWSFIPLVSIFLCNLLIGYAFLGDIHYDKSIKDRYKSMQNTKDTGHGIWKKIQASPDEDAPVWLNSFLGLFIPSCYMMGALPSMLDKLTPRERVDVYKEQSRFQKKVIAYQVLVANTVILISLGAIFYIVNFTGFFYLPNRLSFIDFNICLGLLVFQALVSFLFITEMDVLRRFRISGLSEISESEATKEGIKPSRGCSMPCKLIVSLIFSALVLVPPFAAYICSSFFNLPNIYIITKQDVNSEISIEITKSMLINQFDKFPLVKEMYQCENSTGSTAVLDKIVLLQLSCIAANPSLEAMESAQKVEEYFGGIAGLMLLTSEQSRSTSLPWKYYIFEKVKAFPVLVINPNDFKRILDRVNSTVHLRKDDLTIALSNTSSELYQMNCTSLTPQHSVQLFQRTGYFLGCNGNTKVVANVTVTCMDKGSTCPEINRFENSLANDLENLFSECNRKEGIQEGSMNTYPAVTCTNIFEKWEQAIFLKGNTPEPFKKPRCFNGNNTVYYPEDKCKGENPDVKNEWGRWILSSPCNSEHGDDGARYRFARKSPQCVLMEEEKTDGRRDCIVEGRWGKLPECQFVGKI